MAENSAIEWTDATWNPWHGCRKISAGCKNCYMFRDKERYGQDPAIVTRSKTTFYDPLKWTAPRRIFTCSWSDFFIEESDDWRDQAFAIMALTPQHTYQVLTKRPERMRAELNDTGRWQSIVYAVHNGVLNQLPPKRDRIFHAENFQLPLPNVWLGVSVENQRTANERIPELLKTPAKVRFLSMEPLLGPVVLRSALPQIDWVIVGGESGANARPMHPDWVRSLRDQCVEAGVPFFFKQWGEWAPTSLVRDFTREFKIFEDGSLMYKVGKKLAGRVLDGRTWDQFPEVN